jgi:hypothetical protein
MEPNTNLDRRTVMKGIGATALLGAGLAGTASASSTPSDLKILSHFVSDNNVDNNPSYRVDYGARLKDESAPYSEYTVYGVAKLHNWQGSVEEIKIEGPFELSNPAVKTITGRIGMRGKPNRWYRATFTLLVIDSSGQVAFGDTVIENFKYTGP